MVGDYHAASEPSNVILHTPFCRTTELAAIWSQLEMDDCSAVFLTSERGLGATILLREVAALAAGHGAVVRLHGTPSLSELPFGILVPYFRRKSSAIVRSQVDAIRKFLALFEVQEAGIRAQLGEEADIRRPLIVIDEANHIDTMTADVVVGLVRAGRIKVVIAYRTGTEPAEPLNLLWDAGLAEKFPLLPLSRNAAHSFCSETLGGPISGSASWYCWNAAGGNPLFIRLVLEDALAGGRLRDKGGHWSMDMQAIAAGPLTHEAVKEQLRGLSPDARRALDLLALSEPVAAGTVSGQASSDAIEELFERHLLRETFQGSGVVRLISPVYGEVIRSMVPLLRSQQLHSRLIKELESQAAAPESKLRLVLWTLDAGLPVPDEDLLSAAVMACKLYDSETALHLVGMVAREENAGKAAIVKARAKFNLGEHLEAADLLEPDTGAAQSIAEMLFGGLLRAATHSAIGLSADSIHEDAAQLRLDAERLSRLDPDNAADILWRAGERAEILDLMAHSRAGRYAEMEKHIDNVLSHSAAMEDQDHLCNRSLALAMDAERLSVLGHPMLARDRAHAAFAIAQAEDHSVYFIPEMIIGRTQIASLMAGTWDETEQILQYLSVDVGNAAFFLGGSVGVVRGMVMVRQGKFAMALEELLQSLDALASNDPQQLFGCCAALAAYAAVLAGEAATAREMAHRYRDDEGMYIVFAVGRAFMAAAREHLDRDGAGLAELRRIAGHAAEHGMPTIELIALSLMVDFEPGMVLPGLRSSAEKVEGPWAAGLGAFAGALMGRDAFAAVAVGEQLLDAQMYHHAGRVVRFATTLMDPAKPGDFSRRAREVLQRVEAELGSDHDTRDGAGNARERAEKILTRRELEIALMAARGFADKRIAEELHVSVRTVEGHLYRCYAKLGVDAREQLATALLV